LFRSFHSPFYKTTDRSKFEQSVFEFVSYPLNSDLTASFDCGVGAFSGTITFNHTFAHPPAVTITPQNDNSGLVWSVVITSISTSGCTYVVKYSANGINWTEFDATISYIAMI